MSDFHLRALHQIARLRRRQLREARDAPVPKGSEDRVQNAEDAQSRADAQVAAAVARRGLDQTRRD